MKSEFEAAKRAALEAGKIVMSYYGKEKGISKKGEIDLVTKADLAAEKRIVELLREDFPQHGFVLEEQDSIKGNDFTWVIDPIDGTTSFAHNYPMFAVSVALYRGSEPIIGVVYAPYLKELYTAVKGRGASLNGKKIQVSSVNSIREALVATGFPYTRLTSDHNNLDYLKKIVKTAQGIRRSGSSAIDVCHVACGMCDAYWEIGLKFVDTAAARLILEEAGGEFTTLKGEPVTDDYEEIAASNRILHKEFIRTLGG